MKLIQSFFQTARIVFASKIVYRTNTILGVLERIVRISVPLFVWSALYGASGETAINGRTLSETMIYVLVSQTCTALVSADFASTIENRMRTGVIEYNFIRPLSPRMIFVGEGLGESMYALLRTAIPVVVLGVILIPQLSFSITPVYLLLFLTSLLLGYAVSTVFELLKGMFAFWFVNVYILNWFMDLFYVLLSGSYVPLWFYPNWLRAIAAVLPFQAAYYLPVEIFLGIRDIPGCFAALSVQFFWIIVLWVLQEFLWRKSVYKLTVLGG